MGGGRHGDSVWDVLLGVWQNGGQVVVLGGAGYAAATARTTPGEVASHDRRVAVLDRDLGRWIHDRRKDNAALQGMWLENGHICMADSAGARRASALRRPGRAAALGDREIPARSSVSARPRPPSRGHRATRRAAARWPRRPRIHPVGRVGHPQPSPHSARSPGWRLRGAAMRHPRRERPARPAMRNGARRSALRRGSRQHDRPASSRAHRQRARAAPPAREERP